MVAVRCVAGERQQVSLTELAEVTGRTGRQLAVRRSATGLGAALLDWAVATSRALGCGYLRLDCVSSNSRLRSYYESRGFQHQGDVPVGGAPGQRDSDGPTWVSRYRLPL
ncbi:hypothetical protein EV652_10931 [Kribbella steppae]|uniref:N-acetyltransferase domain-containing protein n=1 Tax=Kribbella steppae TaxID=2512223 RepID=A0A4R2H8F4_9ACTN|nr:GNAT family N-acetyltransferase [Kribbella steppae]TCO23208.1 hypothetical protein EV652_10931 [Kribbella steppae]